MFDAKTDGTSLTFRANYAGTKGGGMYLTGGHDTSSYLRNCKFVQNHAPEGGYAMTIDNLKLMLAQSIVQANYGSPTDAFSKLVELSLSLT